jgi:hypothetical protein
MSVRIVEAPVVHLTGELTNTSQKRSRFSQFSVLSLTKSSSSFNPMPDAHFVSIREIELFEKREYCTFSEPESVI